MTLKKKIISIILAFFLLTIGGAAVYGYSILSSVMTGGLNEATLDINTLLDDDKTVNIALFGIDGRDDVEGDRSDTIMIASVNFETGTVKVVSIMRDLLVKIPATDTVDSSYQKINAAYEIGGPQLAVQTLNSNFDLNIRDYVVVNFDCLVDTVDALGGVDIDVKTDDIMYWTNQYIMDVNDKVKRNDPFLEKTGQQTLTGVQALAYCRNRYSDSDYGRTERQREVVQQIAEKGMNVDLLTAINLIGKVYPYVQTSLTLQEMSSYASAFLALDNKTIENGRVPYDTLNTADYIDDVSFVIPTTLTDNVRVLHGFLFNDSTYLPSTSVSDISSHIQTMSNFNSTVDWTKTTWEDIINIQGSAQENLTSDGFPTPSTTTTDGNTSQTDSASPTPQ